MITHEQNIVQHLIEIVKCARTGDYGAAASKLNRCLLLMQTELANGRVKPENLAIVTKHLETLLTAQKRNDWVAFADVLEYTFIDFWQTNFTGSTH